MQNFSQDSPFFHHGMTHSVIREIILLLLFFSSHLHYKVKILCIFRHYNGPLALNPDRNDVLSTMFVSSKVHFCDTFLTFERSYQSFDKVAIQIF